MSQIKEYRAAASQLKTENPGTSSQMKKGHTKEYRALKTGYQEECLALKSDSYRIIGTKIRLPGKESYRHKSLLYQQ